jgi:hypothetical protein
MTVLLPKGSTMSPDLARAIADDPGRLEACRSYWWRTVTELGMDPAAVARAPALDFATSLPHSGLSSLALLSSRRHLTTTSDEKGMVSMSGCGLSLKAIARDQSGVDAGDVLAAVGPFVNSEAITADEAYRAIRLVREVLDVARGFRHCVAHSADYAEIGLDELLAAFRQESGWVLAPDWASFPHAPLVRTHDRGRVRGNNCRSPNVLFNLAPAARAGYNLAVELPNGFDPSNDVSVRLWLTVANLVVTGGLDSIVSPPRPDTLTELTWRCIKARKGGFKRVQALMAQLGDPAERRYLWHLTAGLLLARVEDSGPWQTTMAKVSNELADDLEGLLDAHRYERGSGRTVYLLDDRTGTAVGRCLSVQARWYKSRSRIDTLLAAIDRKGVSPSSSRLSPFLTYWRYNAGESNFLDTVLGTLVRLGSLEGAWAKGRSSLGTDFPDVLEASSLDRGWLKDSLPDLRKRWRTDVRGRKVSGRRRADVMWREVGLVDALFRHAPPAWLNYPSFPHVDRVLSAASTIALDVIEEVERQRLVPVLNTVLEWTPVATLRELGVLNATTQVPVRTHSFARLREVFAASLP